VEQVVPSQLQEHAGADHTTHDEQNCIEQWQRADQLFFITHWMLQKEMKDTDWYFRFEIPLNRE
jgi:hypothetical protein